MKRIEIILARAVDEEFQQRLEDNSIGHYTLNKRVRGKGYSEPKLGDDVWPQTNNLYIFYSDDKEALKLARIVKTLQEEFPDGGITGYVCDAYSLT